MKNLAIALIINLFASTSTFALVGGQNLEDVRETVVDEVSGPTVKKAVSVGEPTIAKSPHEIPHCVDNKIGWFNGATSRALLQLWSFEKVRHYLSSQWQQGYQFCGEGVSLTIDDKLYYQNFLQIRLWRNGEPGNKRLYVFFQNSSTQGHHGITPRNWVVLNASEVGFQLEKLVGSGETWLVQDQVKSGSELIDLLSGNSHFASPFVAFNKESASSLLISETETEAVYLLGWLRGISTSWSNPFLTVYSPMQAIVYWDKVTGSVTVNSPRSSFRELVIESSQNLKRVKRQLYEIGDEEEAINQFIDQLAFQADWALSNSLANR